MIQDQQEFLDEQAPSSFALIVGRCSECGRPAVGTKMGKEVQWVCLSPSDARSAAEHLLRAAG